MKTVTLLAIVVGLNILVMSCSDPEADLKEVQKSNTVESYRSFINEYKYDNQIREKAIDELSDQPIITMIAIEDIDFDIRKKAFNKITDQGELVMIIFKSKDSEIIDSAWAKLDEQEILMQIADTAKAAKTRIRAIYKIEDEPFLLKRSRVDISDAIRYAAVEQMKTDEILADVATGSYYYKLRRLARSRVTDSKLIAKIDETEANLQKKRKRIQLEKNQELLTEMALQGDCNIICLDATAELINQKALTKVVINSTDRNVAKLAFSKLYDEEGLEKVLQNASDNAIRLAASVKLDQKTIDDIFSEATSNGTTSKDLGDVLAAVALLPNRYYVGNSVTNACLTLIRRGDESRIPELVELLNKYGDVALTEDYLNCGQPDLDLAGRAWAHKHGYGISTGYGSNRARWGSGN